MKPNPILLTLGIMSLAAALIVFMGLFGSASIAHRAFDQWALLIAGVLLIWRAFRPPSQT
jgi:hypothetical protein